MNTLKIFSLFSFCLAFAACGLDWTMRETIPPEQTKEAGDHYANHNTNRLPDEEADKCYAKCMCTDVYSNETEQIFKFTGTNNNAKGVKKETIIHSRASTRWERGKPDPGCKSPNPDDCKVMCLVDVPAAVTTHYVFTDSSINKKFKITEVSVKELARPRGKSSWI